MNPNIALGVQRPRFNTAQDQANALAIQNSRMQQQQNALALQQSQAEAARTAGVRNALAQSGGDLRAARGVYAQAGDIGGVMDIDKHIASMEKGQREQTLGEIKAVVDLSGLLMNPQTYGQGREMLLQTAPTFASRLPEQFDKSILPGIEATALGAKGLLDKQQGERDAAFNEKKFQYQQGQDATANQLARDRLNWQKTKPGQGFSVTTPDGTVVNYGSGGGITNKTQGEAEKRMIEAGDTIAAVTNIRGQFKPTFQQIGTRAQMKVLALKDRAGTLNDDERAKLSEYATYRAEAGQLMSGMLNQLFGAAISEQEMKRGESFLPNTGTGLFDGDSPTEMDSKLKRYEDFTRKALMKAAYIQRNGMTVDQISIDQMPDLMRKRGNELSKEYANLPPNKMMQAVKARLADEFGLVAY